MRIAHVRERHAPAGAPWRLAAALGDPPTRWLDLEVARRRAVAARPACPRRGPLPPAVTTLDDHLARGLRVEALARARRGLRAARRRRRRRPGGRRSRLRAADPAAAVVARLLRASRATSGRCGSAAAARSPRPGTACRSSTSATSRRSAARTTRSGRRPASQRARLRAGGRGPRRHAGRRPAARAGRGGDRRLHDLQRLVGARPPARRDRRPARAGQGQGLRQLVRAVARDARRAGGRAARHAATTWR